MPDKMGDDVAFKLTLTGEGIKIDKEVSEENARKIMNLVMGGTAQEVNSGRVSTGPAVGGGTATDGTRQTAKQFMAEKKPKTDTERVTCLAFYLTHMMDTHAFKARDITKLNQDAYQPKISNITVAVNNASRSRYLTPVGDGNKQITTRGEELVGMLPDREAIKQMKAANPIRKPRKRKAKKQ